MKKILGLDLGTNSIGWALITHDFIAKEGEILGMGSRILPMGQDVISDFNKGVLQSEAATRTNYRGVRRLREREILRRDRLIKVLKEMNWLKTDFEPNHLVPFAYQFEDGKFLFKFMAAYNEMKAWLESKNPTIPFVPFDWTIYYLRVKALKDQLSREELCWVIMQFNQKRGYFQLRGDEELKSTGASKYFVSDKVKIIHDTGEKSAGKMVLYIELEEGIAGTFRSTYVPDWVGKSVDFLVTETTNKKGETKVELTTPSDTDWTFRKKRIEAELSNKHQTVAQKVMDAFARDAMVKIRGKEVHTIDRKFYKEELEKILATQAQYYPELTNGEMSKKLAAVLYKNNLKQKEFTSNQSVIWILLNDILYYQRPLKSKKSLITNCKYETRSYTENGIQKIKKVKAAPKSHPVFQEYKIWSLVHNLRISESKHQLSDGSIESNKDVSYEVLTNDNKAKIFELMDFASEVSADQILKSIGLKATTHAINYEEGKKIKGNETKAIIYKVLKNISGEERAKSIANDQDKLEKIWHMLYSLGKKEDLSKALSIQNLELSREEQEVLADLDPFKKDYGSLSVKAMRKLLSVMRTGSYWKLDNIPVENVEILGHITDATENESISMQSRKQLAHLNGIEDCQGLPEYLAGYAIYGRHSEAENVIIYKNPEDIKLLKQHSLRNPIVEKVINETLLVVRDIWKKYGKPDEIHIETGRELKLPNEKRKELTQRRNQNEATNQRARAILKELSLQDGNINPFSLGHIEQYKLYEEATLNEKDIDDEIIKISRKSDPSVSEIKKYILWQEQRYKSPYTGQIIPLSKLFTPAYQVEHIIPKSLYYDDSINNKVICEAEVNKDKDNELGYNYMLKSNGKTIPGLGGKSIKLLTAEQYVTLVTDLYGPRSSKVKNLLAKEVPDGFIARQLNDTRYISKKIMSLLDPVVREEGETAMISKNIIPTIGAINASLRQEWGLSQVWKDLMTPRFQRMQEKDPTGMWYYKDAEGKVHLRQDNVDIKRLDHRHHAIDALVAACVTRNHVNYLNALNNETIRRDLEGKLLDLTKTRRERSFLKPWPNFTAEAKKMTECIIASFKSDNKIITKAQNYYQKYAQINGEWKKRWVKQENHPDYWAVRQSLHKETVSGQVTLREYTSVTLSNLMGEPDKIANPEIRKKVKAAHALFNGDIKKIRQHFKDNPIILDGIEVVKTEKITFNNQYVATRKPITQDLTLKQLDQITDSGLRKELKAHLEKMDNKPELAFSPEGMEIFNKDRKMPVYKVRIYEDKGKKFPVGENGNKGLKFVEANKGTNLVFVIYKNEKTGEHLTNDLSSIGFNEVVERTKLNLPLADNQEGFNTIILSPNDIVSIRDNMDNIQILKSVSFTGSRAYFIPVNYSSSILDKFEYTSLNKIEKEDSGITIKNNCVKLKVTRLGEIQ